MLRKVDIKKLNDTSLPVGHTLVQPVTAGAAEYVCYTLVSHTRKKGYCGVDAGEQDPEALTPWPDSRGILAA